MEAVFSPDKRQFLLSKFDKIIKLWARGEGHGSFPHSMYTVSDGVPRLHSGLKVGLEDDPAHEPHQ